MTREEKAKIDRLHSQGAGYKKIAMNTGIPEGTIKSYFRRTKRQPVSPEAEHLAAPVENKPVEARRAQPIKPPSDRPAADAAKLCQNCGIPVAQVPGRKVKKFCSDACRMQWWNKNKYQSPRRSLREFVCAACGEAFFAYENSDRKYCSHNCYILGRFHGGKI